MVNETTYALSEDRTLLEHHHQKSHIIINPNKNQLYKPKTISRLIILPSNPKSICYMQTSLTKTRYGYIDAAVNNQVKKRV